MSGRLALSATSFENCARPLGLRETHFSPDRSDRAFLCQTDPRCRACYGRLCATRRYADSGVGLRRTGKGPVRSTRDQGNAHTYAAGDRLGAGAYQSCGGWLTNCGGFEFEVTNQIKPQRQPCRQQYHRNRPVEVARETTGCPPAPERGCRPQSP